MKNVLVLGKGYISSKLEKYWNLEDYNLVRVSRSECDYVDYDKFEALIKKYKPIFVVNCYGFTGRPNVDSCEKYEDECFTLNVTHSVNILRHCFLVGVDLINISTGCVYNDETGRVFKEEDPHNFGYNNPTASVYSQSKSLFEVQTFNNIVGYENFHNLRIRMPFDGVMDDKNYINKIIKYDKLVNYPNSVTYIPDLVKFIEIIVEKKIPKGIYNVVNKNPITAEEVIGLYNERMVKPKTINRWYSTDDLLSEGLMKCRRSNCVLSTEKIEKYFPDLNNAHDVVKKSLDDYIERYQKLLMGGTC